MNAEAIMPQVIATIIASTLIGLLAIIVLEIKTMFNESTNNELIKINRKNIRYWFPTITSLFVLAFEIWFKSPYTTIDLMFIQVSVVIPLFNWTLVFGIGYLEGHLNERTNMNKRLIQKMNKSSERMVKYCEVVKNSNALLREIAKEKPKLFSPNFTQNLDDLDRDLDELLQEISKPI